MPERSEDTASNGGLAQVSNSYIAIVCWTTVRLLLLYREQSAAMIVTNRVEQLEPFDAWRNPAMSAVESR